MPHSLLWHSTHQSSAYAELSNALYEREINQLVNADLHTVTAIQNRLKSLPHYINRIAYLMVKLETPLDLDLQNASWSTKQSKNIPLVGQEIEKIWQWYQKFEIPLGLVVPVRLNDRILLDSIDRLDIKRHRIRTNACGWFTEETIEKDLFAGDNFLANQTVKLLKPTKKIMMSACAGHRWRNATKIQPLLLNLRELLLSCTINWGNFKKTAVTW